MNVLLLRPSDGCLRKKFQLDPHRLPPTFAVASKSSLLHPRLPLSSLPLPDVCFPALALHLRCNTLAWALFSCPDPPSPVRSSSAWASLQPQNRLHAALGGFVVNASFLAASTALKSKPQSRSSRITQDRLHGDSCLTGNPIVFPCQAQSMAAIPTFTGYGGPILSLTGKQRARSTMGMLASWDEARRLGHMVSVWCA